jgi:UDP-3-O-[3-hydroxymyristoyl] glucosamine N-acyltransferase
VIGSDGFGYTLADGQHMKVPHVGHVVIEDNVEIGANTVIDRATIGATMIGEGTKIDNLVQVAHSVKLGKHNILCAFTGIAGSTVSGNHVVFAANVGVSDHVRIDDGVILGARAGVPPKKHLRHGNIYLGNPARPRDKAIEQELATTRIPIIRKNLKQLSDKVSQILARLDADKAE